MTLRMILLFFTLPMIACNNQKASSLSPAQQKARFDSVLNAEIKEAMENEAQLQRDRMEIEMKEKIDSIENRINQKKAAQSKSNPDSTHSIVSKLTDSSILNPKP